MEAFSSLLRGGNPRSLGRTDEVIDIVLRDRTRLPELFERVFDENEIVRMRAGDALEKICRQQPDWFAPYVERLLTEVAKIRQPSVQWHLAQMLTEIPLDKSQKQRAAAIMQHNLLTMDEWVVTNLTLEALATFVRRGDFRTDEFIPLLKRHANSRHKSVANRCRKLLQEFHH